MGFSNVEWLLLSQWNAKWIVLNEVFLDLDVLYQIGRDMAATAAHRVRRNAPY